MLKTPTKSRSGHQIIGPEHHGRPMLLDDFDNVESKEGYLYELNKGVIEVTYIPHRRHLLQLEATYRQLYSYDLGNPGVIELLGRPDSTKLLIEAEQSERHPDIAVYTTPMPDVDEIWSIWVPTIAIEIASESSAKRDYNDKTDEYLAFGISEYWIIDAFEKQMTVLSRFRGIWKEQVVKPSQKYTTRRLPGFSLDLKRILNAAK